jgi:hypothetical protein
MTDQEQQKWLKQIELAHDLAKHMTTVAVGILAFSALFIRELKIPAWAVWGLGLSLGGAIFAGILMGTQIARRLRTFDLTSVADDRLLRVLYFQMGLIVLGLILLLSAK